MKYIDAEKLKTEIERLYDGEAPKHDQQCDFDDGYFTGIGAISKFIDSLQKEQEEKAKTRAAASTCRNCKFSEPRLYRTDTLSCTKRIVNKFYTKVVRPSESCDLFERKEE